jgi:hypothetical protein
MTGPRACPLCANSLPPDAPHGLCPRCLLDSALRPPPAQVSTTPPGAPFTAPDPVALAPLFPQLEVLELLGQGGMGAVYKARQVKLDRLVALKVLPPEVGKDPAFAERFTREARALARLGHPHVVGVHDFGESGGLFYLLMEYVDGGNLREAMAGGQPGPAEALAVVGQVCDALEYAHAEGVVHRDVKPENILLDRRGRVKVADFGLAKLAGGPRAEWTLTGSRQVVGTLDYMAPEQRTRPQEVDHRADVYSVGVVLYELLTGELPLGRFAPPSQQAPVDPRLDDVVFRALERDPGRRYQRVSEIRRDVESVAAGASPGAAGPAGPPRRGGRGFLRSFLTYFYSQPDAAPSVAGGPLSASREVAPPRVPANGTVGAVAPGRRLTPLPRPAEADGPRRWNAAWWAALVGAAVVVCCFLPWSIFHLQGFVGNEVAVMDGGVAAAYVRVNPSDTSGVRSANGAVAAVVAAGLVYALLATGALRSPARWHGWAMIAAGALVAALAGLYLLQPPRPGEADWDLSDTGIRNVGGLMNYGAAPTGPVQDMRLRQRTVEQYSYAMRTAPRAGAYLTFGLGVVLLLLGAPSLRPPARPDPVSARAEAPPTETEQIGL